MLKPINRLGHTKPLNAPAICFVAMIDPYDTTIPTEDIMMGLSADHLLKNCKWDWNQITTCDAIKKNMPIVNAL